MEIDDLYQDIILDHYKHPRHSRRMTEAEAMVDVMVSASSPTATRATEAGRSGFPSTTSGAPFKRFTESDL